MKLFEPIWERYELAQSILPVCAGAVGWKSLIDGGREGFQEELDRARLRSIVLSSFLPTAASVRRSSHTSPRRGSTRRRATCGPSTSSSPTS